MSSEFKTYHSGSWEIRVFGWNGMINSNCSLVPSPLAKIQFYSYLNVNAKMKDERKMLLTDLWIVWMYVHIDEAWKYWQTISCNNLNGVLMVFSEGIKWEYCSELG